MKSTHLKAILLSLALSSISLISFSQKLLFKVTTDTGTVAERFDSTMTGPKLNIKVDISLLSSNSNQQFKIILPNGYPHGTGVIAKKIKQKPTPDQFAWYGQIEDQPRSFVLLTQVKDVIAGHIRTNDNKIYRITYIGNKVHEIRLIDQQFFKPDKVDLPVHLDAITNNQLSRETASCCDASEIDVLVVYTPQVLRDAGSISGINSQIFESINITNESFVNSNIPATIQLAHSELVQYQEGSSIVDIRNALQDPHDGQMDAVHSMRDRYHADIVILLIENSPVYDGLSYIMDNVSPAFESNAFCIVKRSSAFSNLTFAHEIGHILGARHECNADNAMTPFPYSHGYSVDRYRTIMSENVSATRVEFWSDPNIKFTGTNDATGSMSGNCQAVDAECLRNTIAVVSKFRCNQRCVSGEPTIEATTTSNTTAELRQSTVTPTPQDPESGSHSNKWLIIIIAAIVVIAIMILLIVLKKRKQ